MCFLPDRVSKVCLGGALWVGISLETHRSTVCKGIQRWTTELTQVQGWTSGLLERLERSLIAGRLNRRGFIRAAAATGFGMAGLEVLADELDSARANQMERAARLQPAYDYVVVGTRTAACALVGRLATRKDASILMIEAGDWDTAPSVMNPGVWFTNLGTERDWGDVAIPSTGTNNRAIPEHMGRVVGGNSIAIWARPLQKRPGTLGCRQRRQGLGL